MKIFKYGVLLLVILQTLYAKEMPLERVSLQLQWLDQFQFAGYYVAKEKGFYRDAGLIVDIKPFKMGDDVVKKVTSHQVEYATGRSSLIIQKSYGKKICILSAIFQASPLVMIAKTSSNITKISDFKDKRIVLTGTEYSASIFAMMASQNITLKNLNITKSTNKMQSLLDGKADLISAYSSNQAYILKQKGIDIKIFDPKDYGFDFYGDILFTSEDEINNHKHRSINFNKASIKGWNYAFSHIDETVELIRKKYNIQHKSKETLTYEANELKKLAYFHTKKLGHIDPNKIQRIYDIYNVMGYIKDEVDLDKFIFYDNRSSTIDLSHEEIEYLKKKKEISVCVKKDWLPFEDIENGKFVGICADYLKLYSSKLSLKIKVIGINSQRQSLKSLKEKWCDVVPIVSDYNKKLNPYKATIENTSDTIALVTRIEKPFISNLEYLNKSVVMVKSFKGCLNYIKENYPLLKILKVDSIDQALEIVASGKVYGFIGLSLSSSYKIQRKYSTKLKITNNFKKIQKSIGVRDDDPILLGILNKVIKKTTLSQDRKILNHWMVTTVEKEKDYSFAYKILAVIFVILLILIYKNYLASKYSKVLENQQIILQNTQNNFDLGQEIANIGIWSLDYKSKDLEWSKGVHYIFETDVEEFGASREALMRFIHPEDRGKVSKAYKDSIRNRTDYFIEHRIITAGKNLKYVEERCQNFFDKDGKPIKSLGTVLDITTRKVAELELEHLNKTLEDKIKVEIEKNRQKEQKLLQHSRLAQMGEMISMIAHQWRQPLGAISTTAVNLKLKLQLESFDLEHKEGIEEASSYFLDRLKMIETYVKNLTLTIDDFRNFYKPNKEHVSIKLRDIISKSLDVIEASLSNNNIEVIKDYNDTKSMKLYDSEMMQVVLNILKNAQDNFIEKKTKDAYIKIITKDATISICDNGGGIDSKIIEKIFDPYYSTKDEKNGTGLGLYMSKLIVQDHHNGILSAKNTDDGVCFKINL